MQASSVGIVLYNQATGHLLRACHDKLRRGYSFPSEVQHAERTDGTYLTHQLGQRRKRPNYHLHQK